MNVLQGCLDQKPRWVPVHGSSLAWVHCQSFMTYAYRTALQLFAFSRFQVFPDWFSENILSVWTEGLQNWSDMGVEFSGIWLDMNEASSFCSDSW
jgi:hypothetical protein